MDLRIKPKQTLLGVYITYIHFIYTCAVNLITYSDTNTKLMIKLFSIPILIQYDYVPNKQTKTYVGYKVHINTKTKLKQHLLIHHTSTYGS